MFLSAHRILEKVCPVDIYSTQRVIVPSPTREHIFPRKYLPSKKAIDDLNNIFVCTSTMNSMRGVLPFGNASVTDGLCLDGRTGLPFLEGQCFATDECIRGRGIFIPPVHARGAIARTCMYMAVQYSLNVSQAIEPELLLHWDLQYPPEPWELERAFRIWRLGYHFNPFVAVRSATHFKDLF